MERRKLGDSDLEISEISLGSWLTYSGGVGREQTAGCTRAAFDAGINFFDTANAYGRGAAASGVRLSQDVLDAIDAALGDHPVTESLPASSPGVKHR